MSLIVTRAIRGLAMDVVVLLQDVATGNVDHRIATGFAAEDNRPTLVGDPARLAIVFGGVRWGDLAVVDLATGEVTTHAAKRCPK